jgi:hypothetical protein
MHHAESFMLVGGIVFLTYIQFPTHKLDQRIEVIIIWLCCDYYDIDIRSISVVMKRFIYLELDKNQHINDFSLQVIEDNLAWLCPLEVL